MGSKRTKSLVFNRIWARSAPKAWYLTLQLKQLFTPSNKITEKFQEYSRNYIVNPLINFLSLQDCLILTVEMYKLTFKCLIYISINAFFYILQIYIKYINVTCQGCSEKCVFLNTAWLVHSRNYDNTKYA